MGRDIDLTPFGFTTTESHVYAALLRLGPSTGYAVAHAIRVARANTYGALEGLVGRSAAHRVAGRPARYRAADPQALLAQLAAEQGAALDRLGAALVDAAGVGEPDTRSVGGARALANVILQVVARAERRVEGVLAAELLRSTMPAWRRAKERATVELRVAGAAPADASPLVSGAVSPEAPTILLIDDTQAVIGTGRAEATAGAWSSHPAVAALARAALRGLG